MFTWHLQCLRTYNFRSKVKAHDTCVGKSWVRIFSSSNLPLPLGTPHWSLRANEWTSKSFHPCLWSRRLPPSRKGQLRILWLKRLRKNNVLEVVHGFSLGCGASDTQKTSRLFKFATSAYNYFTISYSIWAFLILKAIRQILYTRARWPMQLTLLI